VGQVCPTEKLDETRPVDATDAASTQAIRDATGLG
jgi:hypothetical protein